MNADTEFAAFVQRLDTAARAWRGTPFRMNSCTRGPKGGVCCHYFVWAIYKEAGLGFPKPAPGTAGHARWHKHSLMEPLLAACPAFYRRQDGCTPVAGDLLGFRLNHAIHHLGILLPDGLFAHAMEGIGVALVPLADPTWSKRLGGVWGPALPQLISTHHFRGGHP